MRMSAIAGLGLSVLCAAASANAETAESRRHIQRIEDAILNGVLIEGGAANATPLTERMKALHVLGLSVAFVHGGAIEWARGYGVTKTGGPAVTPDTLFQAGSISKVVAAAAALHLAQTGKVDLDADVNAYLKGWSVPKNAFTAQRPVTLRELVSHTAGTNVHSFDGYEPGKPVPSLVQVLDGLPPANNEPIRVIETPGTVWRYSGGGYVIAQKLMEDATGEPFARFARETVFAPLGMDRSFYEQVLPYGRLDDAAWPYDDHGAPVPQGVRVYPEMTAAGLWSTATDLARFLIGIQNALAGKGDAVLDARMAAAMVKHGGVGNFGLGLHLSQSTDHPYFDAGGANFGFRAYMLAYDSGDGIAFMSNGDNGQDLELEILRTVAHEYGWPDFQPPTIKRASVGAKTMDEVSGYYERTADTVLHVFRDGDRLFAQSTGNPKFELLPASGSVWYRIETAAKLTFVRDGSGRVTRIEISQGGQDVVEKRLDDGKAHAVESRFRAHN